MAKQVHNQSAVPAQTQQAPSQQMQQQMPPAPPVTNPFGQYPAQQYSIDQPFPEEIRGFNFGAFFFTWIWGLANGVYWPLIIILIGLIPGVGAIAGLVIAIVLGCQANELAWKNRQWDSVEHFKAVQKTWNNWAFALLAAAVGFFVLLFLGLLVSGR